MGIVWTVYEIIEHLIVSRLSSVWPWMKVKVNIINAWCILMPEAVTVLSGMMMTSIISEESHARDRHAHRQTHTHTHTHTHTQWMTQLGSSTLTFTTLQTKSVHVWCIMMLDYHNRSSLPPLRVSKEAAERVVIIRNLKYMYVFIFMIHPALCCHSDKSAEVSHRGIASRRLYQILTTVSVLR